MFLQETHFKTHHMPKRTGLFFTRAYHATNDTSKSKGVSILVNKEAPSFEVTDQLIDTGGGFFFSKGNVRWLPITLANVYFPNTTHLMFCKCIVQELQGFASRCLILGGDFNIPLNPLVETLTSKTSITYKVKKLKTLLNPFS